MLATRHGHDSTTRDPEQDLAATFARGYDSNGQPREGFFNLTQRMENEAEDQLDVDLTVFDFLMHKAISTAFEWQARADKYDSDLPNALITMTAEWRSFLSQKHKGQKLSSVTAFRSRLLQFVLLLTHRYHPTQTWTSEESLRQLKQQNVVRGTLWSDLYGSQNEHTNSSQILDEHTIKAARQRRASELDLPSSFGTDGFSDADRPTLDQLLLIFIEVTAARACLDDEWQPTSEWYDLAGQFMLQAIIDQYIVDGYCHQETRTAIFAFGSPGAARNDEKPDIAAIRTLFCKEDSPSEERPEWTAIRRRYIKQSNAITSFEQTIGQHSYVKFEQNLLSCLQHLHDSVVKPDLMQVEEGHINIDGHELSRVESREMIKRMRL